MRKPLQALCATLLLSGCSLIPDFARPAPPVPDAWPTRPDAGAAPAAGMSAADMAWADVFAAPPLRRLIEQALANNRDLRVAALNIEVARAQHGAARADLFPQLDATAGFSEQRTARAMSKSSPKKAVFTREASVGLGVTAWELDLFGRLSSLEAQALESYLASEEARAATRIALIAEVANAWLAWLGDRDLLRLTEETLDSRLKSLELIQRSFEHGISSELDLAQARTAVETARANQARYRRQLDQDRNALALLLGGPVGDDLLAGDLGDARLVEDLPVGLPSETLLKRPDIAKAEHDLRAANANIGAARAAFFPSIQLTGSAGYASPSLGNLFQAASGAWAFGPQASVPIFDWGRNQANLDAAKANREIAVAQYEKAIQTAFREVADALSARATLADQARAQADLVAAAATSLRLSQARYQRGVSSYLDVLDSQRALYSAQQDLITVQVTRLGNLVTLYKALGGGRQ